MLRALTYIAQSNNVDGARHSVTSRCCGKALERTSCPNTMSASWSRLSTHGSRIWVSIGAQKGPPIGVQ